MPFLPLGYANITVILKDSTVKQCIVAWFSFLIYKKTLCIDY